MRGRGEKGKERGEKEGGRDRGVFVGVNRKIFYDVKVKFMNKIISPGQPFLSFFF